MADTTTTVTNATEPTNTSAQQTQTQTQTQTSTNQQAQTLNLSPEMEKFVQSAVDRATQKLGTENKNLRMELEELQKKSMSDDEIKAKTIEKKERELAQQAAILKDKENRLFAVQAIKDIGLDDGSDLSMALVDFVLADDEEGIKAKVKTFNDLINKFVESQVSKTFKDNGRIPDKGNGDQKSKETNIATKIGKSMANSNKQSQDTINFYLGGK